MASNVDEAYRQMMKTAVSLITVRPSNQKLVKNFLQNGEPYAIRDYQISRLKSDTIQSIRLQFYRCQEGFKHLFIALLVYVRAYYNCMYPI